MRLALSSAAAPDMPLSELLRASAMRGLAGLELVLDTAPLGSTEPLDDPLERIIQAERAGGGRVLSLAIVGEDQPPEPALRLARGLRLPLLLPPAVLDRVPSHVLRQHAAESGKVLLLLGTSALSASDLQDRISAHPAGSLGVALDIDPAAGDHASIVQEVLDTAGPDLAYIRLRGGGPEAAQQTGLGVGALMARLALARFTGPLVLTPSTPRYHHVWRTWLGRAGGWGCGSKHSDDSLAVLAATPDR